jgi:hypothetical protein
MHRADSLTTIMCWLSWNLRTSTSWNPQGLYRHVLGLLYLYFTFYFDIMVVFMKGDDVVVMVMMGSVKMKQSLLVILSCNVKWQWHHTNNFCKVQVHPFFLSSCHERSYIFGSNLLLLNLKGNKLETDNSIKCFAWNHFNVTEIQISE